MKGRKLGKDEVMKEMIPCYINGPFPFVTE
jgi:hypothetical protein